MAPRPSNLFNAETLLGLYRVADYGSFAAAVRQATADGGGVVLCTGFQDFDPTTPVPTNVSVLDSGGLALHQQMLTARRRFDAVFADVTYTRSAIALRFDDGPNNDYSIIYPALKQYGLVGGFAIVNGWRDTGGFMTTAQIQEINSWGNEILCHSQTHGTVPTTGDLIAQFQTETTGALAGLTTALGLNVDSFIQPGTWNMGTPTGPWHFDSAAKADLSYFGRYLSANFAAWAGYRPDDPIVQGPNYSMPLPRRFRYGYAHQTWLDPAPNSGVPLATVERWVDGVANYPGCGLEILVHSAGLNLAGNPTTADYQSLIAYIANYVSQGMLDVLTPTGLVLATKNPTKVNYLNDPSFEAQTGGSWQYGWQAETGAPTLYTSGGHTGANAAEIPYAAALRQYLRADCLRGVRLEAWVKSTGAGTTPRLYLRAHDSGGTQLTSVEYLATAQSIGATWTKVTLSAAVPSAATDLEVLCYGSPNSGDPAYLIDDLTVFKV